MSNPTTTEPGVARFKIGDVVALKCDGEDPPMLFRVRQVGERVSCRPLRTKRRGGYLFKHEDIVRHEQSKPQQCCPKCERKVRLRADGKIPAHTIELSRACRGRRDAWKRNRCPASGTIPKPQQ